MNVVVGICVCSGGNMCIKWWEYVNVVVGICECSGGNICM